LEYGARRFILYYPNTLKEDIKSKHQTMTMPRRDQSKKVKRTGAADRSTSFRGGQQPDRLLQEHWGKHYNNTNSTASSKGATSRAVWSGRILFLCVLFTLAFLLSALTYKLLTEDEANLAETQFRSISERALIQAKEGLLSRRWAGVTLANSVAQLYPSAQQWPFVEWPGFEQVVNDMLQTIRGEDMGFIPFVSPSESPEFEVFAQNVYRKLGFPNTTGVISPDAGFGVWARNTSVTLVQKYHDTAAETPYESPYTLLAPIFRTDEGCHPVLMFNPHSQKFTGEAIDQLLACSEKRKVEYQDLLSSFDVNNTIVPTIPHQCGVITDIFFNVKLGGRWSVANFLPIYPYQDPLNVRTVTFSFLLGRSIKNDDDRRDDNYLLCGDAHGSGSSSFLIISQHRS
jgi:hypothetical protein